MALTHSFQVMKIFRIIAIILIVFAVFRIGVELFANYRLANSKEHQESLRKVEESMFEIRSASDAAMDASARPMRAGDEKSLQISSSVTMAFCWCPAGNFVMGSPQTEIGRGSDEAQVSVNLTKGFWMAKTEVTQDQWMAIMGSNPSKHKGSKLPVDSVGWNEIQDFIIKLNTKIENSKVEQVVLPTEVQWEYACRAGEKGPYSGGTINDVAWYGDNGNVQPHPVGAKKSNAWGLHDMHGNVMEMCSSYYNDVLPSGTNPVGETNGDRRIVRGGSWLFTAEECRAASRNGIWPDANLHYMGFRPVLVQSE
jgi:formylglycine-generating enzyme required for sulfatase activity